MPVFDCEGNGLYPSKFHVLSYNDNGKIKSLTSHKEMKDWLLNQSTLIGHNIIRWDIPHLERVLGIKITARLIDTLPISWYLFDSDREKHGLEEWGETFGVEKPSVVDWENEPLEVYVHRCEQDVVINTKLWALEKDYLAVLYENDEPELLPIVDYLSFKMDCAREQEVSGWKLDKEKCKANLEKLTAIKDEKEEAVRGFMPKVPKYKAYKRPAKPFTKSGELSVHGQNWKARCESLGLTFDYEGDIKVLSSWEEPNPSSPQQVKDWLFSLGWQPITFKYVKEDDGNVRAIPQVKKLMEPEFCDSVRELYEKEPSLEILEGLSIINHRIGLLRGFLEKETDGWLKAEIGGLTNTLRFKHVKPCVNLPGTDKLFGLEVRECLIADLGYELSGSDMTALEDLTKRHYMMPFDPDYVEEMSKPGFDPHLDLALRSGKISEEDLEFYKWASKDDNLGENAKAQLKPIKKLRQDYKKTNYSATYGIGADKLSRELRTSRKVAKQLLDDYWERNWAIRKVADVQKVRSVNKQKWLFNPVSKFYYSLREEKDRFSTLNQSTGVYCFDLWIMEFRKKRPQLTAQFHDEVVLHIKQGFRDKCNALLQGAIDAVNDKLKLNVTLSIDIKYGQNYGSIH